MNRLQPFANLQTYKQLSNSKLQIPFAQCKQLLQPCNFLIIN